MSDSIPLADLARGPAAKFVNIGDTFSGRIATARREQQRDFETGQPMTWTNGDPQMQTVIELETEDGTVTLYARGGKTGEIAQGEGMSMEMAIASAVREAGGQSIDAGAKLAVRHSGLGKPTRTGFNGMKLFVAQYQLPAPKGASVDLDLFAT